MLRYLTELHKTYNLPIIQLVIYIGKHKVNMQNKINFKNHYTQIDYKYELINIKDLNYEDFINSNNSKLVILAILCDFKNNDKKEIVHKIIKRLRLLSDGDRNELNTNIFKLDIFSQLRNLTDIVKEEQKMITDEIRIENLASYSLGMDKGINKRNMEIAKNLLKLNIDMNSIISSTGLTMQDIKNLKNELMKNIQASKQILI